MNPFILILAAGAAILMYLNNKKADVKESSVLQVKSPILETAPRRILPGQITERPVSFVNKEPEPVIRQTVLASNPSIIAQATPGATKVVAAAVIESLKLIPAQITTADVTKIEEGKATQQAAIQTAARAVVISNAATTAANKAEARAAVTKSPQDKREAARTAQNALKARQKARIAMDRLTT